MIYRIYISVFIFVYSIVGYAYQPYNWSFHSIESQQQIAPGVTWESHKYDDLFGVRLNVQVVRVDLQKAEVKPLQYSGCKKVSRVAEQEGAIIAVNGTFFDSNCRSRNLLKVNGQLFSTNQIRKAGSVALLIDKQQRVSMRYLESKEDPGSAYHGIGGFPQLVKEGEVNVRPRETISFYTNRHPRTAIGIRGDKKMIFAAIDGRSSQSRGLTIDQLAQYMKDLGATDAMNVDGGGSTVMWIDGEGVVNRPSGSSGERRVADGLAIF